MPQAASAFLSFIDPPTSFIAGAMITIELATTTQKWGVSVCCNAASFDRLDRGRMQREGSLALMP